MGDRVSVIICAYTLDRWPLLVAAVESALDQDPSPDEVVLVVDHNAELHGELLDRFGDRSSVTVVDNAALKGLSGARNTGVATASGEILVFLDDDATASPGWLEQLCAPFEDDRVMGAGGRAVPVWDPTAPPWFPEEFWWIVGCTYKGAATEAVEIRNPIGCNMALRRSAIELAGGFVEGVGRIGSHLLGCEETLLCIAVRQRSPGARILHVPDAVVRHHVASDRHRTRYFRRRCYGEGLSKAMVARHVGRSDGLSSERTYVTRTLPMGVLNGVLESIRTRRTDGLQRSTMIVVGFCWTAAGYLVGTLRR